MPPLISVPEASLLKRQPVAFDDRPGLLEIHFHAVARGNRRHGGGVEGLPEGMHFSERLLEASGRNNFKYSRRGIPGIPEGVPLASWLDDQIPDAAEHFVAFEMGTDAALKHEAKFIFSTVTM